MSDRHSRPVMSAAGRHDLCLQFERFLDAVLDDQENPNSYAFRVLADEWGTSVTSSIMQAADVRKMRRTHKGYSI